MVALYSLKTTTAGLFAALALAPASLAFGPCSLTVEVYDVFGAVLDDPTVEVARVGVDGSDENGEPSQAMFALLAGQARDLPCGVYDLTVSKKRWPDHHQRVLVFSDVFVRVGLEDPTVLHPTPPSKARNIATLVVPQDDTSWSIVVIPLLNRRQSKIERRVEPSASRYTFRLAPGAYIITATSGNRPSGLTKFELGRFEDAVVHIDWQKP